MTCVSLMLYVSYVTELRSLALSGLRIFRFRSILRICTFAIVYVTGIYENGKRSGIGIVACVFNFSS